MTTKRTMFRVLFFVGLLGGAILAGCASPATQGAGVPLPALAEQVRKGEIDVGKSYGMAPDRRFHKVHTEVVGLQCATCHTEKVRGGAEIFTLPPAVDVSPESPGLNDRRVCLGCHTAEPGKNIYGPRS